MLGICLYFVKTAHQWHGKIMNKNTMAGVESILK